MLRKWLSIIIAFGLLIAGVTAFVWLVAIARNLSLLFIGSSIMIVGLAAGWIYEDWTEWFPPRKETTIAAASPSKFKVIPAVLFAVVLGVFSYMEWSFWIPVMLIALYVISELDEKIADLKYDLSNQRTEMELMAEQIRNLNWRMHEAERSSAGGRDEF